MKDITFYPLEEKDLPLLHKWLNEPHVVEWYSKKSSTPEEVKNEYLPRIKGDDSTKSYLFSLDGMTIGYIQSYLVKDDPALSKYLDGNTVGIDLFIGEASMLNKGLGPKIIREFVHKMIFLNSTTTTCIVDPSPSNIRMIKANEKAGFKYLLTTTGNEPKYLMTIKK